MVYTCNAENMVFSLVGAYPTQFLAVPHVRGSLPLGSLCLPPRSKDRAYNFSPRPFKVESTRALQLRDVLLHTTCPVKQK